MRYLALTILSISLAGGALAQNHGTYWSVGGFGNVLYPGTGHAPNAPPPPAIGGRGTFTGGGRNFVGAPIPAQHPQHGRTVIVPYPVYYGGYAGGYPGYDSPQPYEPGQQVAPDVNSAPSVVINQNFIPPQANPVVREYNPGDTTSDQQPGMRLYQAPPTHPYADSANTTAVQRRTAKDEEPTIYLIAFKDHSIVQALGYWMEGGNLHYVSAEHTLNQASMDLIDRNLSQRLNDERSVEFKLPNH